MKKTAFCFILCLCLILACGCSASLYSEGNGDFNIVASSFPAFDTARQVVGNTAKITLLQSSGADLHNYTPSPQALKALTEADIFICNGGVSDELWLSKTLLAADNPDLIIIKMQDFASELHPDTQGHNHSEYCTANHPHANHSHEHSHGDGHASDEHVWLSLKTMMSVTTAIADACASISPVNSDFYQSRCASYVSKLSQLDTEYTDTASRSITKTLVFADRFPFAHMSGDYGLCYFAAFSGCSTESDASFDTFASLCEVIKSNGVSYVIITETGDQKLADALQRQTGCKIAVLNSMQSISQNEIKNGATYLQIMQNNLNVLKAVL